MNYLKTLSQTPFIGIVKGFFNGNGVGYDVTGYAENYDCLISKVKVTVWSYAKCIAQGLVFCLNSNVDYACTNAMA